MTDFKLIKCHNTPWVWTPGASRPEWRYLWVYSDVDRAALEAEHAKLVYQDKTLNQGFADWLVSTDNATEAVAETWGE